MQEGGEDDTKETIRAARVDTVGKNCGGAGEGDVIGK